MEFNDFRREMEENKEEEDKGITVSKEKTVRDTYDKAENSQETKTKI